MGRVGYYRENSVLEGEVITINLLELNMFLSCSVVSTSILVVSMAALRGQKLPKNTNVPMGGKTGIQPFIVEVVTKMNEQHSL